MHCRICGKDSEKKRECRTCRYFLGKNVDEETLRKMCGDDETKKIWKENEKIAQKLADAYYDSVIENYKKSQINKGSREEFGYNTFIDGVRVGLDIILPLMDENGRKMIKEKIKNMVKLRSNDEFQTQI